MMRFGFVAFKVLFCALCMDFSVYGQSPKKDGALQELTSVMQKSDFLKNVEIEGSTVEACDWDGDDSACPFMPPESSEFFIRTATKMSCANAAATNFLKNKKLSYLDLKITDIMDSRSRARSVLSRDTSRRDYAKFKGEERVTFSLIAWTTVESVDSGKEKWSRLDNSPGGGNHFIRGRYVDMINGRSGNNGANRSRYNYIHKGLWLKKINDDTNAWTNVIKKIQRRYFLAFDNIQYSYDELVKSTRGRTNNNPRGSGLVHEADRNRWARVDYDTRPYYVDQPLIMPPLAHRVHVIGYDDDVMPNAGEALLRCADEEAGNRGERKVFEPDEAFDRRVCLNYDDWRRAKVEETSSQIAKRNKRLLKAYFAKVYDPESSDVIYRPWEGNPERTGPYRGGIYSSFRGTNLNFFRNLSSEKPSLVYATYFAVQSCHTGATDMPDPSFGNVGTAYNRIKSLKDKITTLEGQNSLRETYWRHLDWEGFGGLEDWSCEPRGSSKECLCRMKQDDMKKEYHFGIKRWNPEHRVTLSENHGGVNNDLTQLKCFKALEKSFSNRGAEYHNCGYYIGGSGGRGGAVLSDENRHNRLKIRKYCNDVRSGALGPSGHRN